MKRILLIIILLLFSFSCSIKKKVVTKTEENKETKTETRIKEETIDIRTPKSNISIFDQIRFDSNGLIIPTKRTIVDPVTNQTLEYEITEKGDIKVLSITQADTIRKTKKDIVENTQTNENTKTNTTVDTKVKFSLGQLLTLVTTFIGGVVPGVGGIFMIIPLLLLLPFILIIRRIFRKKETK
jgi:hypothetical protein